MITRNRPGVARCDNCGRPKRPTVSWSLADNTDGLGVQGLGSVHLCESCLLEHATILAGLPPFMEVMRHELSEAGVAYAPKARYEEIMVLYRKAGLAPALHPITAPAPQEPTAAVSTSTQPPSATQLTIPEIRRMRRDELEAYVQASAEPFETEPLTVEQIRELLVTRAEAATVA